MAMHNNRSPMSSPSFLLEMLSFTIVILCTGALILTLVSGVRDWTLVFAIAGVLVLAIASLIVLVNDPDIIRARQTDSI